MKVFVGLSGGVDSSVAALRLKRAGHEVTGVFIRTWHPDFIECNEEEERVFAMRVAAHLEIPFLTLDAIEDYKKGVADYMIEEYEKGRTPNPDVLCNRSVKFGAFWNFAQAHGADAIATGHYAQIKDGALYKAADKEKDQTYFLWMLTKEDLSHILFPIGDTEKPDIRKEALDAGLPTAEKRDSQGVCFLGHIDMKEFLSHYVPPSKGDVLDESGKIIGHHDGAVYYTTGQRHGFHINADEVNTKAHYVIARDVKANTLTVSERKPVSRGGIKLSRINLISEIEDSESIEMRTRYRGTLSTATLQKVDGQYSVLVTRDVDLPSAGQSAVFYRDDECLGGGIIEE